MLVTSDAIPSLFCGHHLHLNFKLKLVFFFSFFFSTLTALRLFVQDSGSTSIQAADSTAINGSITPTDKRYCTPSLQNIFLIITSEMYLKADHRG